MIGHRDATNQIAHSTRPVQRLTQAVSRDLLVGRADLAFARSFFLRVRQGLLGACLFLSR
jgi:hypothetical protein